MSEHHSDERVADTPDEQDTTMTITTPTEPITLESLEALTHELDSIEERRAALVAQRDAMIRVLRHNVSAPRIGKITGLSTSGIYKIEKETHQ